MFSDLTQCLPRLRNIPFAKLVEKSTPVHRLDRVSEQLGINLITKREDFTDTLYGGNKVRNLEFILGAVQAAGLKSVYTLAPLGSNFVAALAAQCKRLGIVAHVEHFTPTLNAQVLAHYDFSLAQGTRLRRYAGRVGVVPAVVMAAEHFFSSRVWISPGGSNVLGALGHVGAALEFAGQLKRSGTKEPEVLYVGVGTCGTLAGLSVGFRLAGLRTRIVGVRCVDALICNPRKVSLLANRLSRFLGLESRWGSRDFHVVDSVIGVHYGVSHPMVNEAIAFFADEEGMILDTTYTGKVVAHLLEDVRSGRLSSRQVAYWHTFSPGALAFAKTDKLLGLPSGRAFLS